MQFNAMEEMLGEDLAKQLIDTDLLPHTDESIMATVTQAKISHLCKLNVDIPITVPDVERRGFLLKRYAKFFEEVSEKIKVRAAEMVAGVYISDQMTQQLYLGATVILCRILLGDPAYIKYLDKRGAVDSFVRLSIKFAIGRNPERAGRTLEWMVVTEAWEMIKEEPNQAQFAGLIEMLTEQPDINTN